MLNISDILDITTTKRPHTASAGKQTFVMKKTSYFPHLALSTMCTFLTQQGLRPKPQSSCQCQRQKALWGLGDTKSQGSALKKKE